MKSSLQAVILCTLAIAFAYFMTYMFFNYGDVDTNGSQIDIYQQAMLDDKTLFVEMEMPVQDVAAKLVDCDALLIMRDAEGRPRVIENGRALPLSDSDLDPVLQEALETIFGENEAGVTIRMVTATPDAVSYFTDFFEDGFVGFLYEKELDNTTDYETIEIVENWKLFYRMTQQT